MWTECVPGVNPSIANRNGTTRPSAYAELFPFRSPFCQLHGVVSFAHWSRLTLRASACTTGTESVPPSSAGPPAPKNPPNASSTTRAMTLHGLSNRVRVSFDLKLRSSFDLAGANDLVGVNAARIGAAPSGARRGPYGRARAAGSQVARTLSVATPGCGRFHDDGP